MDVLSIIFATFSLILSMAIWIIIDIKDGKIIEYRNDLLRCEKSTKYQLEYYERISKEDKEKIDELRKVNMKQRKVISYLSDSLEIFGYNTEINISEKGFTVDIRKKD